MRVLVTGIDGFVGRHLARELAACGHEVLGTTILSDPGAGWPADVPVAFVPCDLVKAGAAREAVRKARPELVFHLASQSHVPRSWADPTHTLAVNVLGTANLLEAIRIEQPSARMLLVSSADVYGTTDPGRPLIESDPTHPTSPYAVSKLAGEHLAQAYVLRYDLAIVRVRPSIHTGPGQPPPFVIPSFCRRLARIEHGLESPVLRVGNLKVRRDFTDVRDMARAYVAILERAQSGACYNARWGDGVWLDEVVKMLEGLARVRFTVEVDPALVRPVETVRLSCDSGRLDRDIGFEPRIPFERTLEDTLAYWREMERPGGSPPGE